jgi:hypothetical protein
VHYLYYEWATPLAHWCIDPSRSSLLTSYLEASGDLSPMVRLAGPGGAMKLVHLCYAAIGFAIARWVFHRQAVLVADPVARYRSSGLL